MPLEHLNSELSLIRCDICEKFDTNICLIAHEALIEHFNAAIVFLYLNFSQNFNCDGRWTGLRIKGQYYTFAYNVFLRLQK